MIKYNFNKKKAVKTRYTCEEAIQFILEPNSDSGMSNFDGDDSNDGQHANDKMEEWINDNSVATHDKNNNRTMGYHMEETPPPSPSPSPPPPPLLRHCVVP